MKRKILTAIAAVFALGTALHAQPSIQEFKDVPKEYRPRVWWHWMNGNVTRDGIRKDLEWMDRAGIAGFHCFDANISTPQIVDQRLVYMTDAWKDAFNYALDVADSLGMEVTVASSPGWSITGGPWVTEEDAEKKIVWRELIIDGGTRYQGSLPEPYTNCGPYQDELGYPYEPDAYRWYEDLFVIAVRLPQEDTARILHSKVKAGFTVDYKIADRFPTPDTDDVVARKDVLDLTGKFKDGTLTWNVPEGRWKIFRFGWNLLGRKNGPASPEATGLEVDKLDADAVRRYYANYLGMYRDASGGRLGSVISHLMIDSYESGRGTWTRNMEQEFRKRRGYALRPWLPVLTGQIIGSAAESEAFLFDWRQTLGELMAENHYDVVNDILAPFGMKRHSEAHEERRAFVGDGMMVKRHADIPMSAFWVRYRAGWHDLYPGAEADLRESSSVAHIYGQNICAAESFTTNGMPGKWDGSWAYQCTPGMLKPAADAALASGLNRFVIHCSVHQPVDDRIPGLGLGFYGQWFNRHDTWAEEAKTWTDYLSRNCYMLRQGVNVADIAWFYGEDKNLTGRFYDEAPPHLQGVNYDFVNGDIICNVLKPRGKSLRTASGMDYKILVIDPEVRYMSWPVLRSIWKMVRAGVVICGHKPEFCAGLNAPQKRFWRTVSRIWDSGRRNVVTSGNIYEAMCAAGLDCDIAVDGISAEAQDSVRFVHRRLAEGDIYWVANLSDSARDMQVSVPVRGKKPEIWHADSGTAEDVTFSTGESWTTVTLHMDANDSQFIVLTKDTEADSGMVQRKTEVSGTTVGGPWEVRFQEGRGAPEKVLWTELKSYTESPVPGIRYFSGTATYSCRFTAEKKECMVLDLGNVCEMARVILNGNDLGLLWKAPYRTDVTEALIDGENILEIRVTNSWMNRLIGDEQPGVSERITYTSKKFYSQDDALSPAGLLGPVRLIEMK